MKLNRRGEIVREEWFASAHIREEIHLVPEEFVVMPNHIHGIVWIVETTVGADGVRPDATEIIHAMLRPVVTGATGRSPLRPIGPPRKSLGSFMAGFKTAVTKRIRLELNETGIWQRNYHDHIIRDERALDNIRRYILANPSNWSKDEENPRPG